MNETVGLFDDAIPGPTRGDQGHIIQMLQYPIPIYFDIFVLIQLIEGDKRLIKLGIFAIYIKISTNYRFFLLSSCQKSIFLNSN